MRFIPENLTKTVPRLGKLYNIQNHDCFLPTPMVMLYTKGGSIPHTSYDVFNLICHCDAILQVPLTSTYSFYPAISDYHGPMSDYIGMKSCSTFLCLNDPAELTQSGHHINNQVPIWTRNGKVMINPDKYMDLVEKYKPDMYSILADTDTNVASSNKRIIKSVDNTISFFKTCIERHKKSERLKNKFVLASITGGYNLKERKRCLDLVTETETVDGYLIEGLHNNGPEVEFIPEHEVQPVIKYDHLPCDKVRILQGCWNPLMIIYLVQLGVDIFDTSYCYIVTERSAALTFSLDINDVDLKPFEINLREAKYADDFRPIDENCCCLTCTEHTRSYIHHLLVVQELLGPLLLTIHNIHHYLEFFKRIRKCIEEKNLDQYQIKISKEFVELEKKNH